MRVPLKKATPPHKQTGLCDFDRSSSLSCDTYVCACGWPFGVHEKQVVGRKLRYARKQLYSRTRKAK